MQWYVQDPSGLYEVVPQRSIDMHSLASFAWSLRLFESVGTFWAKPGMFVFRSDTLVSFFAQDFFIRRTDPSSVNLRGLIEKKNVEKDFVEHGNLFLNWVFYHQAIPVVGPVSYVNLESKSKQVVLFGDVHDNFAARGMSDQDVRNATTFLQSSRGFYTYPPDFESFDREVDHIRLHFATRYHDTSVAQHLFVWEFLALWLRLATFMPSSPDIEVLLEAPLQNDFAAEPMNTYLDAVRNLFSVCPAITTPDSPFAPFLPHCSALFPKVKVRRVDLRFALNEQPKGPFLNDDPITVLTTIGSALQLSKIRRTAKLKELIGDFAHYLRTNHKTTDQDDERLLLQEMLITLRAVRHTPIIKENTDLFIDVLLKAVQLHWQPTSRSPWFLFRTCLTDIYGLATLWQSPATRQFAYLGDYHVRVWRDVLTQFAHFEVRAESYSTLEHRTIYFQAESVKPFMDVVSWNKDQIADTLFRYFSEIHSIREVGPKLWEFFEQMKDEDRDVWLKGFLVELLNAEDKFAQNLELIDQIPMSMLPWKTDAEDEVASRLRLVPEVVGKCKGEEEDVFQNEFADMTSEQLLGVYVNERGQCVSAFSMLQWWEQEAKQGRVFRDPITRQVVSAQERQTIQTLTNAHAPLLHHNPVSWVLTHQPDGMVVLRSGARQWQVLYLPNVVESELVGVAQTYLVLREVFQHINGLELRDGQVFHESIHFNLYRNRHLWESDAKSTLRRLQDELEPFSTVVFQR